MTARCWTVEEVDYLRQAYQSGKKASDIAKRLGRTILSVRCKAQKLGIRHSRYWSEDDLFYLGLAVEDKESGYKELGQFLGRSKSALVHKIKVVGRPGGLKRNFWTEEEKIVLLKSYQTADLEELAKRMGRSRLSLMQKAYTLGIYRQSPSKLTDPDKMRELFEAGYSYQEVAEYFGSTYHNVLKYASAKRLKARVRAGNRSHPWRFDNDIIFANRRNDEKT